MNDSLRRLVIAEVSCLGRGQWITYSREMMREIGSAPLLGPDGPIWSAPEWVLEGVIGACWGFYYFEDVQTGDVTFCRCKDLTGKIRTFVSPDRRHFYRRNFDGTYDALPRESCVLRSVSEG